MLAERDAWCVDDVPEAIPEDVLEELDALGWVECYVWEEHTYNDDRNRPVEFTHTSGGWVSLHRHSKFTKSFHEFLKPWEQSGITDVRSEIRVSTEGRARLNPQAAGGAIEADG